METTSSYLALMPITKTEINKFSDQLKSEILSGYVDPLKIAVQLKAMDELISGLRKDAEIQAEISTLVERNGNSCEYAGAKVEIRDRTEYDYSGDAECCQLEADIDILKERLKERQKSLQNVRETIIVEGSGEVLHPLPKKSKPILMVSLKK